MKKIKKGDKFRCTQDFKNQNGTIIFKKDNIYESLSDSTLCSTVNKDHPIQFILGDAFKQFFKRDKREPVGIKGTNIGNGNWVVTTTGKDSIVESVIKKFKDRSDVGIKKYGTTLDRQDLTKLDWISHAQEEAMDLILYLERLKNEERRNK
jgi:hypothetical protein